MRMMMMTGRDMRMAVYIDWRITIAITMAGQVTVTPATVPTGRNPLNNVY